MILLKDSEKYEMMVMVKLEKCVEMTSTARRMDEEEKKITVTWSEYGAHRSRAAYPQASALRSACDSLLSDTSQIWFFQLFSDSFLLGNGRCCILETITSKLQVIKNWLWDPRSTPYWDGNLFSLTWREVITGPVSERFGITNPGPLQISEWVVWQDTWLNDSWWTFWVFPRQTT